MEGTSLGIVIAFTAGLLSFLSPCVLPLIPSYVTFITGLSLEDVQKARRAALAVAGAEIVAQGADETRAAEGGALGRAR
jgi:cytochrome c biogenesis protein CcdA